MALTKVIGAYGIAVLCADEPGILIAARKDSPLVVGLGTNEYFVASDAAPIVEYTNNVVYINDNDIAILKNDRFTLNNILNSPVSLTIEQPNLNIGELDKGEFEHFMLKEIFEQPKIIEDAFRGRLNPAKPEIVLGGLLDVMPKIMDTRRIIIIGCGTSWHAGLIGEYLIEEYAGIPVEVEYASEFRYRKLVINKDDIVLAINQSGETADTLAAMNMAKEKGAMLLGICNVTGSTLSHITEAGVYSHAGAEIGVASTKAFTAQVTVLVMLALKIAMLKNNITPEEYEDIIKELATVPEKIKEILKDNEQIKEIAAKYKDATSSLFLGRGYLFPVALEGELKLTPTWLYPSSPPYITSNCKISGTLHIFLPPVVFVRSL